MKKWTTRIVLAVVIIVVVVVGGVFFFINSLAKAAIEKGATHAMGVQTTVGSVRVGLGDMGLGDLDIANPQGYTSDHFLTLGHGEAAVSLGSLTKETIEVPYIRLKKIDMNLEEKDGKANFQQIMDHLSKLSSSDSSSSKEKGKGYIVKELTLTDITVRADVEGQTLPIEIKEIRMNDIGSGNSVDMQQLSGIIMKAIFESLLKNPDALPGIMASKLHKGIGEIGNLGVEGVQEVITQFQDVAGENIQKITGGAGEKISEEAGKAIEGIGDLLGGKKKEGQ